MITYKNPCLAIQVIKTSNNQVYKHYYLNDCRNELGSGYEQWGVLNGSINIDGIDTPHIHLNSLRQHSWSEGDFKSRQSTVAFVEDDTMISINFTQGKIRSDYIIFLPLHVQIRAR